MYNNILFLLIFSVNVIHSMEQQSILTHIISHKDIAWAFTERLSIGNTQVDNDYQFFKGKKNFFHSLLFLNKTFYNYYSNEYIQQRVIDNFAQQRYVSTLTITQHLWFPQIGKKIIDLHKKASTKDMMFTQEDLAERNSWYLNSTTDENHMILGHHSCLLTSVIWNKQVEKAEILINNSSFSCQTLPLQCVIRARQDTDDHQELTTFLNIFTLLLTRLSSDHRYSVQDQTPLQCAARYDDKDIAQLLLEKGANPFLLCSCFLKKPYSITDTYDHIKSIPNHYGLGNAFSFAEGKPQGWLMKMYKEVQKKKETNSDI